MSAENFNSGISGLADTGQWRLIVLLSETGMTALLKNTDNQEIKPLLLFKREWEKSDSSLLENIETAVYDNPRILEDFATLFILQTPKSLWIPSEYTEDEEFDANLFTEVFPIEEEDISADFSGEEVSLFTLVAGLNSFIRRTMPGSRITSQISVLKNSFHQMELHRLKRLSPEGRLSAVYINIYHGFVDIIAFLDGKMVCGATHTWREYPDILYRVLLILKGYGIKPSETELFINHDEGAGYNVDYLFREFFGSVSILAIDKISEHETVPTAALLAAGESVQLCG